MGVWEFVEKSKDYREISSMARSAWFGLHSFIKGRRDEKPEYTMMWINNGINVCNIFEQALEVINSTTNQNPNNLASYYRYKPVKRELEEKFGNTENFKFKVQETKVLLEELKKIVGQGKIPKLSRESLDKSQEFFNNISNPYFNLADFWLQQA